MIRLAQLLLIVSALGLWVASRLPWASVESSDGLGQPTTTTLNGAAWSNALLPLAVLLLAAALAGLAVRGWLLRVVSVLIALVCLLLGYLGISLIAMPDVAARAAELAGVPVMNLVASDRNIAGAVLTLAAAAGALVAAALLMRAAATEARRAAKYAGPSDSGVEHGNAGSSERGMWDALDEGLDPTQRGSDSGGAAPTESGTEGR